jgi:hypothetical protein
MCVRGDAAEQGNEVRRQRTSRRVVTQDPAEPARRCVLASYRAGSTSLGHTARAWALDLPPRIREDSQEPVKLLAILRRDLARRSRVEQAHLVQRDVLLLHEVGHALGLGAESVWRSAAGDELFSCTGRNAVSPQGSSMTSFRVSTRSGRDRVRARTRTDRAI